VRERLVLYCIIFQIFVTVCPSFSVSVLISSVLMESFFFYIQKFWVEIQPDCLRGLLLFIVVLLFVLTDVKAVIYF
jgi:hypothetical protein